MRMGFSGLLTLVAVAAMATLVNVRAGEDPAPLPGPPGPVPAPIPAPAPAPLPAVNGIDGRVAQRWALRAILEKIDNTGVQYQVAAPLTYTGSETIELKRAGSDTPPPEGLPALKERVVQAKGLFEALFTPVIQTRETIANAQRTRYSVGVYFADLTTFEEKLQLATVTPATPAGPDGVAPVIPAAVVLPDEVRVIRRAGDGILIRQGETVLMDSKSGIAVEGAPGFLERMRGVSVLEVPAWPEGVALPGERIVEPTEQPPAILGALGQIFAMKLPLEGKPGAEWRVALDVTSLCGLPLKHAHAVVAHFTTVAVPQRDFNEEVGVSGTYIFALQGDEFRGDSEVLAALARLEKTADTRDWKVQGAVGRGRFDLRYSPKDRRVVSAQWTETLTQLNLQAGSYDRRAYVGTREVSIAVKK
ncbi:MAG TPA: hypothetical protein VL860_08525 [Planctomycetota bacterium]|nr:hypothetical protein [Planctomycetota bacterium]